jgi:hypothetical protein
LRNCIFIFLFFVIALYAKHAQAQSFNEDSLRATVSFLASDAMKGRRNYTPELYSCAQFISARFEKAGLKFFPECSSYFLPFMFSPRNSNDSLRNETNSLFNVVGMINGRTKPQEAIIISAHYDHVGVMNHNIYNGANDNASGIAALLALAEYYSTEKTNDRTIIFCAFSGEEAGLYGSSDFAQFVNPGSIVAVLNMDMVGAPSFGKRKYCITGASYSDLQKIFNRNLKGEDVKIVAENGTNDLFRRSDNYSFARLGIPAHTIMTSDEESYKCYHQPCDDTRNIDFKNLALISRSIVIGLSTIISGQDTPLRIKEKFY